MGSDTGGSIAKFLIDFHVIIAKMRETIRYGAPDAKDDVRGLAPAFNQHGD